MIIYRGSHFHYILRMSKMTRGRPECCLSQKMKIGSERTSKQFWYTQFESKMLWNIAKLCSNHLNTQTMSLEPILTWECHDLLATRYAEACYSQTGMVSCYSLSLADRESQVPLDTRSLLTSALGIRNKLCYVPRRGVVKSRPVFSSGIDASSY
jgi:hypothetical protein